MESEIKKQKRGSSNITDNSYSKSLQTKQLLENIKEISDKFIKEDINYEICGTFNLDSDNNIIGYSYNPEYKIKEKFGRNSCTYDNIKKLSNKLWHTHPDKYYPSYEDIMFIFNKKRNCITYFTRNTKLANCNEFIIRN